jgi:predicted aconitase
MHLTPDEQRMLAGSEGPLVQEAMRFLVKLGEAYGAERMVDISYANVFIGSSFWGKGALTPGLLQDAVAAGMRVKVPTTFNNWGPGSPLGDQAVWETMDVPSHIRELVLQENQVARSLGIIPTWTCAPYLICDTGWYPKGSHISAVESSAIVYFNSVLGARTNRDCLAAFFAAVTGKYPECGYHLDENRYGVYHIDIQTSIEDKTDYGLLGLYVGKMVGLDTPVFTGLARPRTRDLMELSAALASSGAVTLFHIVGVTPEAPDLATAFGGRQPRKRIAVTRQDLEATHINLTDREGKVDFVCLGCPHYSIYEMKKVAELLDGKRVHKDVTLWICTAPQTALFADMAGYTEPIRRAGATIMSGPAFCPLFSPGRPGPEYTFAHFDYSIGGFATDAAKQAYYARSNLRAEKVFLGSTEQCIASAIAGEWRPV